MASLLAKAVDSHCDAAFVPKVILIRLVAVSGLNLEFSFRQRLRTRQRGRRRGSAPHLLSHALFLLPFDYS
jgi:hypothetical protein